MALYSEQYRCHGLSKSGLRKILEEMFSDCDNLQYPHVFTQSCWRIGQVVHYRYFLYRQLVRDCRKKRESVYS